MAGKRSTFIVILSSTSPTPLIGRVEQEPESFAKVFSLGSNLGFESACRKEGVGERHG